MDGMRHAVRGTTHAPSARNVTCPSGVKMGRATPLHPPAPWLRPLLIVAGTAAALLVLLAARPW